MQAVILAAGRGTRFGPFTEKTPKCLLTLLGQPLIFHVLNSLPKKISAIVIATHYLPNQVKTTVGPSFNQRPVRYVDTGGFNGTAGALWSARSFLKDEFLVVNSDDLFSQSELTEFIRLPLAFGVISIKPPTSSYLEIISENNLLRRLEKISPAKPNRPIDIATGAYKLNPKIFSYQPVPIKNGEFGLPQTILAMATDHPIAIYHFKNWLSINNPAELKTAELKLQTNPLNPHSS